MVVVDGYVLPFSEVLDWSRASIRVHPHDVYQLFDILEKISDEQETELREQVSKGIPFTYIMIYTYVHIRIYIHNISIMT